MSKTATMIDVIGQRLGPGDVVVTVNGKRLSPERSQKVWNHSPDGFEFGYGGSGPAQLALAILLEAGIEKDRAVRLHQRFKWAFIAKPDVTGPARGDSFTFKVDVEAWAHQEETARE